MAKRTTTQIQIIDPKTIVELIMIKDDLVFYKELTLEEAELVIKNKHPSMKKKKRWMYQIFQKGFSQYNNKKKI